MTTDSLILLPNGGGKWAANIVVGDVIWTPDEHTLQYVAARVLSVSFEADEVFANLGYPDATALHRFALPLPRVMLRLLPEKWRWFRAFRFGRSKGQAMVAKITTTAGTYMARHHAPGSKWKLSHNVKPPL